VPLVDDPITYKNAPISVQLVGKTLEEEAVIAMSEIVDKALKAHSPVVRSQL
jgi:amidase